MVALKHKVRGFVEWYDRQQLLKTLGMPLFAASPPVVLSLQRSLPVVENFLKEHPKTLILVCVVWAVVPLTWRWICIVCKPPTVLTADQLVTLTEMLDRIVSKKDKRFSAYLTSLRRTPSRQLKKKRERLFEDITQPRVQMAEIVAIVWQLFHTLHPKNSVRVALAEMDDTHVREVIATEPSEDHIRSPIEKLRTDGSGYSTSKRLKRILVIPNTKKESERGDNARFVVTRKDLEDEENSMICFPIEERLDRTIPYVLSISVDRPDAFREEESDAYTDMLIPFARRIAMEHTLERIKNI